MWLFLELLSKRVEDVFSRENWKETWIFQKDGWFHLFFDVRLTMQKNSRNLFWEVFFDFPCWERKKARNPLRRASKSS